MTARAGLGPALLLCLHILSTSAGGQEASRVKLAVRHVNIAGQFRLLSEARAVCDSFLAWYGPCAADEIVIVAPGARTPEGAAGRVVALSRRPIPYTRADLRELSRRLAREWFPGDESDSSAWLGQGLAAHAAARYLEQVYGPSNLLDMPFRLPQLSGLGEDYLIRVLDYVAASNRLPAGLSAAEPGSVLDELSSARAAHFIGAMRREFGADTFDAAVRFYRDTGGAEEASVDNFIRALSLASRRNVHRLFSGRNESAQDLDYAIVGYRARGDEVELALRRVGSIPLPLEVELRYRDGATERYTLDSVAGPTVRLPLRGRLRQVALDPRRRLPEFDRWNNYWPRRVEVRPVFALPSLEAYQLFYGPYAWYDNYHGFQLGAWMQGRRFVDAGPLRGRHMWTLSETYSTKIGDWHTGASYQTPLGFLSDRLRVSCLGDYSHIASGIRLSLFWELGRPFLLPNGLVDFGYRFFDLKNDRLRDARAWEKARTGEVRARLLHSYAAGRLAGGGQLYLGRGQRGFGSEGRFVYWKGFLDETHTLRVASWLKLRARVFAGAVAGEVPRQDRFYLSGGLVPNSSEPVSWGHLGMSSPQERWHYDADVNCRGFAGEYRSGRFAYGLNFYLDVPFVAPFFDLGNVADDAREPGLLRPKMNAGVRLRLGPLYADFPFWRYSDRAGHELAFRWMLGLKLGSGI